MLRPHDRVGRLLSAAPLAGTARLFSGGRLRVLAYHDVRDDARFSRHLDIIQAHYRPVSGDEVALAARGRGRLPRRAIWLTFDDAHPGVFTHAQPLLTDRDLPATVFSCPGVVDTERPYWWEALDFALERGHAITHDGRTWSDRSVITHLKRVPDHARRATVRRVIDELTQSGAPPTSPQATTEALRSWLDAGLEVGNHTWDHPCLDMCDDDEQRRQIVAADDWLRELLGRPPRLFAYPNGNVALASRAVLAERGYTVAALFDHRLARVRGREVSRLRIDADAPPERLAAIASGAHPAAFALVQRLRGANRAPRDTP